MKRLLLKVCGMRESANVQALAEVRPDFIGFIFYPKSARYVGGDDFEASKLVPGSIKKVGVFVNESEETLLSIVKQYQLDYVQLHGGESVAYVKSLREKGLKIIKVFSVSDELPQDISDFEPYIDYLLFDTHTKAYGGSGEKFHWDLLQSYASEVPFLLSGGLSLEDIDHIQSLDLPQLVGIDVNSRFEVSPGVKDIGRIKLLKEKL